MSTKELAYSIIDQLSEEELQSFVALFRKIYPPKNEVKADYQELGSTSDDIEERRAAFARLEKLCRPMPDLNEEKELAEYREEKYGK